MRVVASVDIRPKNLGADKSSDNPPLGRGKIAAEKLVTKAEAFALCSKIHKIVRDGGQESLKHSFTGPEGEVQTRLTVEQWERNGKSGYAISVHRGEEQINVPVQSDQFLFAAEFLRHLSLQQAWVEEPERAAG